MKPTRNSLNAGCGWSSAGTVTHGMRTVSFGHEFKPTRKPTLADKLRAYRDALRDEGREPVDTFCRRGETTARFAYFD